MSENETIRIGLRAVDSCDPKEISNFLLREVFPDLRYRTIYEHFGRKMTLLAIRRKEGVSPAEALEFLNQRAPIWDAAIEREK